MWVIATDVALFMVCLSCLLGTRIGRAQIGRTDRDAAWKAHSSGPREPRRPIRKGSTLASSGEYDWLICTAVAMRTGAAITVTTYIFICNFLLYYFFIQSSCFCRLSTDTVKPFTHDVTLVQQQFAMPISWMPFLRILRDRKIYFVSFVAKA